MHIGRLDEFAVRMQLHIVRITYAAYAVYYARIMQEILIRIMIIHHS